MVAFLEFTAMRTEPLRDFLRRGDDALRDTLLEHGSVVYPHGDEESRERRFVWSEIVRSFSGGPLGQNFADQPLFDVAVGFPVSATKALVFSAVLRHFGSVVATVSHSSAAAEVFSTEPFDALRRMGILGDLDPLVFLSRPLFRHYAPAKPSWGGLTAAELKALDHDRLRDAVADTGDSDVDSWVNAILNGLEEAVLRGTDLVTLYD